MIDTLFVGGAHVDRVALPAVPFHAGASHPGVVRESVGGACFNAARAFRLFDGQASLVSARGGDAGGLSVASALSDAGISDRMMTWLDRPTPSYFALLDDRRGLVGAVADMALYDLLTPRVLNRRSLRDALTAAKGLMIDANLPGESCREIARRAEGTLVAAIAVSRSKVLKLRPALSSLSILFLTRNEAASLLEYAEDCPAIELVEGLHAAGLQRAVMTDGAHPVTILDSGRVVVQPSRAVEEIQDVTGAGDTLAGTVFFFLLSGHSLIEAVRMGIAAAARHIAGELSAETTPLCREEANRLPAPSFVD